MLDRGGQGKGGKGAVCVERPILSEFPSTFKLNAGLPPVGLISRPFKFEIGKVQE